MDSLRGLFDASEQVTCLEFQRFAEKLLPDKGLGLAWAPWVQSAQRPFFESSTKPCGQAWAGIRGWDGQGRPLAAGERAGYLPITFVAPAGLGQPLLGYDLFSDPLRREAAEKARDQNVLMASQLIRQAQDRGPPISLVLLAPVYAKQADTGSVEARRKAFRGSVVGLLQFGDMIDDALKPLGSKRNSLRIRLEAGDGDVIYADPDFNADSPLVQVDILSLGARHWRFAMSGNELEFGGGWSTWFVLAGGMCLSGIVGGFLLLLAGRTATMEGLITQRTADLASSNQRLREEIAERARMEQEAKRLAMVAEKSTSGIIITDACGRIEWVNPAFSAMTGYSFEDVAGQTPGALLQGPGSDPAIIAHMRDCIGRQQGFDVEILNYRKSGEPVWLQLKVDPVFDDRQVLTQFVGVETDITRRKMAEQALYQAKLAADKASSAKSEFLANMSHEIRTPMNGVLGMLELLRGTGLDTEQQELADIAGQSAESLMAIINDILDFSKIEAGKLKIERIGFDLRELCEMVCALMAIPAKAKGLDLVCVLDPELDPDRLGDPTRLRQILTNLLGNAAKFTPQGEVSLTVRAETRLAEGSRRVRFEVRDTGIGISPAEMGRLFQPFEQADQGAARRFGGTGLGLSISKSLVSLMGGEMGAESVPGQGSTFWFSVDLEPAQTADPTGRQRVVPSAWDEPELPQFPGRQVLLVEDNPVNQQVALKMLERFGIEARLAATGAQALRELEAERFDLVFMDCQLPELDGFAVTQALRAREQALGLGRTPVLALTANAINGDRERSLAAGMDEHLTKPLAMEELGNALVAWLGGAVPPGLSAKASSPSGPVWDQQACLDGFCGDQAFLEEVKALFVSHVPGQLECMRQAKDSAAIAAAAHGLRGMASPFQAKAVIGLCAEIEAKARREGILPSDPLITLLRQEVERLVLALAE